MSDECPTCGQRPESVIAAAVRAEERERLTSVVQYGHQTEGLGWVPEYRGINYATYQRTMHYRTDEPVVIDHFTYADHRHPVEGCMHDRHDLTTAADIEARLASRKEARNA